MFFVIVGRYFKRTYQGKMMAKFIRLIRQSEEMEILINVDNISRIEVRYGVPSNNPDDHNLWGVTLREAFTNPNAVRTYKIFAGGESYLLAPDFDDPVIRVIQDIYHKAIKAPEPHELPDSENPASDS